MRRPAPPELGLSLVNAAAAAHATVRPECQVQHWQEGGHDKLCKLIKEAGGAGQYHANKKYKEAVAVAVEACADDTKGQTCFICTQALHWKTKEGLVRVCVPRDGGFRARVRAWRSRRRFWSRRPRENNLGTKALNARWERWHTCSLCEQRYHDVVRCALGWACWKTIRPAGDGPGSALSDDASWERSIRCSSPRGRVARAERPKLSMMRRLGCLRQHAGRAEPICEHLSAT